MSTDLGEVVKDRAERDAVRHFQTYSYSNPFHFFFFHSFFFSSQQYAGVAAQF